MGIEVKICGVTTAEAADAAIAAHADYLGLVFHPASPRHVAPGKAAALAARVHGKVRLVALFEDANDDAIAAAVDAVAPDFLQLHGREAPVRVADIRTKFGTPVIKALHVADLADLTFVPMYESAADMLLFDAKAPAASDCGGGHGVAFDWQLLKGRKFARPWLLAGGLNADNVARAVAASGAPGVDVSSGVESAKGVKSAELIHAFVRAARRAPESKTEPGSVRPGDLL
jgi:phosphoribosylanthranilate isomerase